MLRWRPGHRHHPRAALIPDPFHAFVRFADGGPGGGVTVGVKDVFDTADMPTEYGSPIWAGWRPRADAAAVALLRRAGAAIVGKTVTAELAWFTPGPTTNPHRPTHTPGGSSSGSAAAVAAGQVELALGTQTGGSVIRPASFCGVFGFKPTFGLVPTAGVKQAAPSCDTVGFFARDVATLRWAFETTARRPSTDDAADVRFALVRTDDWDAATGESQRAVLAAAVGVGAVERALPRDLHGLGADQQIVQAYEGARSLAWERTAHPDLLSERLRGILDWGDGITVDDYDAVVRRARHAPIDELFGDADVVVTPAVVGEAPASLETTGDPRFCRLWTLLGLPAITVPGCVGDTGMPVGVQLVARHGEDARLLTAAEQVATYL